MKSKKIISLIVAAGMVMGTAGITPVIANAQGVKNVNVYSNVQTSSQKAVVNKKVAVMNGSTVVGYANQYDMATITSNNGSTCKVTTEFGLTGTVETSALNMVKSGVNQSLNELNENGYVTNVTTVLNVRTEATTNSVVKAQLTNNTNFKIVGQQGDWLKINVEGISGFVFNEFTSKGQSSVGGQVVSGSNMATSTTTSTTTSNGSITKTPSMNNTSNTRTSSGNVVINNTSSSATNSAPVENHDKTANITPSKTTPVENHDKTTNVAPSKTTPVENHDKTTDTTPSKTTPVEHHDKTTDTTPSKTTPVEHHDKTTDTTPSKTTPVEHHDKTTDTTPSKTTPVEHHDKTTNTTPSKTTPVEHHDKTTDTTPSKTTPVEHHDKTTNTTPSKTTPVEHHDTTPSKTTPVEQAYTYMPQLSQEVFNGLSGLRTNVGVPALTQSSSANATAMALAQQMAKDGNADHSFNEMGAMCPEGNANYIVNMFKNSPEHYSELTNKLYTEAGVAVYKNNKTGEYFTAVKFIAPSTSGIHWHSMS